MEILICSTRDHGRIEANLLAQGGQPIIIKNKSIPTGRNLALAKAVGVNVLFTDDDCIPNPNWVAQMEDDLKSHSVVAGGIRIVGSGDEAHRIDAEMFLRQDLYASWHSPCTANLGMRRELFDSGSFDESVTRGSDRQWFITRGGLPTYYNESNYVVHPARTMCQLETKVREFAANGLHLHWPSWRSEETEWLKQCWLAQYNSLKVSGSL